MEAKFVIGTYAKMLPTISEKQHFRPGGDMRDHSSRTPLTSQVSKEVLFLFPSV